MHNYRNARNAEAVAAFWGKSLVDKDWYAIKQDGNTAEILIYDVIGWPFIDANQFVRDLNAITADNITVGINSPGGDVFDGTAIYNALKNHPATITTRIDGIAASMASIIALTGDTIQIADNAYYMMHNAWGFTMGDYRDHKKAADLLDRITETLAATYVERTGKSMKDVRTMLDDETWLIGQELVDAGLADQLIPKSDASANFNLEMYNNVPEDIRAHGDDEPQNNPPPKSIREVERGLRAMGYSRAESCKFAGLITSAQRESGAGSQGDLDTDSDLLKAAQNLCTQIQQAL